MAEKSIPSSGDPRVDAALARIREKFTDLEDAMVVQAHLEKGMAEQLKNHARILAKHDEMVERHDAWIAEAAEREKHLDERIQNLVSGMAEWMRRTDNLVKKLEARS
jgi:hypothetical protein